MTESYPRIGLVTFGGGQTDLRAAPRRLAKQARKSRRFALMSINTDRTLRREHQNFWNCHRKMLTKDVRGFGYWIWKPYLINHALRSWQGKVDLVFYIDSGCEINTMSESEDRWEEYVQMLSGGSGRFVMQQTYVEKHWQKMDAVLKLGISSDSLESGQILGGILGFRVCEENIRFTQEWLELCTSDNYHLVDDTPSVVENEPYFIEHRHDQSIFSALIKRYGASVIPDESFFGPDWQTSGKNFPIWAVRNKSGVSVIDNSLMSSLQKFKAQMLGKIEFEFEKIKKKLIGSK